MSGIGGPNIITNGLVGYWDAGNSRSYSGSGTSWNDLITGNVVTLANSPTFSSGVFTFNGTNQYATTTTLPTTAISNFSMSAWINPSSLNQIGMAVSNGRDDGSNSPFNGYAFGVGNGTGNAGSKFQVLNSTVAWNDTGYTFPSTNTWYNIVRTRDSTTSRFYVNGVQTPSTSTTTPLTPTGNFTIGAGFGVFATRYFAGKISIVKIYTSALSDSDILQNYNAIRGRYGI